MSLRPNVYCLPEDGDEVVALLEKHGDGALVLAGGTFIHGLDTRGLLSGVSAVVDIQKVDLGGVESDGDGLRIGATTRCRTLAADSAVREDPALGAVRDALAHLPMQVANAATVGGAVATACPFFDLPVAFMALGADVAARGKAGTRRIPLAELFTGLFENALEEGEFLTELRLPKAPAGSGSAFAKLAGNANDLAIVNAGVQLAVDGSGTCTHARVVIGGGVGATPVRSASAEQVLVGARLDDGVLHAAGEASTKDVEPFSDHRASGGYRRTIAGVLVRRALERATTRLA